MSLLFSLIYSEIMVLNFNKNIKENIIEREKNERIQQLISVEWKK